MAEHYELSETRRFEEFEKVMALIEGAEVVHARKIEL